MSRRARETTCRIIDLMDDQVYDARMIAEIALDYLSEADVHDMAMRNDLVDALRDEWED